MNKIIGILSVLVLLCSCAEQYNIAGNSSVAGLDGRMLYLRVSNNENSVVALDSCKVIHGRFQFMGDVDSIVLAHLYMGNENMMPLVIENGNLTVQVDKVAQRVTGSPLNDKLYKFFQKRNRLENEMWELEHCCIRLMRSGKWNEKEAHRYLKEAEELNRKQEELETRFVMDNYNNVLGPGMFILLCSQFPSPVITDQIDRIIRKAHRSFMRNPFIENYLRRARQAGRQDEDKEEEQDPYR